MTLPALILAASLSAASQEEDRPVSYSREVLPIFKRSCMGCHNPQKKKGKFDMTTVAALRAGGKSGNPIVPGDAAGSRLYKMICGPDPEMPEDGDALKEAEVALVGRWIRQGAKDDTPPEPSAPARAEPPVYTAPPSISALAWSPDGTLLAVSGYREIVLHEADGAAIAARLPGESPRIEAIVFTPDGKTLVACGGSPAQFGQVQVWDMASRTPARSFRITGDLLYGVSISPDGTRIAFGCADKSVRMIDAADGREVMKFDAHTDWPFGTAFAGDGKRLLSGSRDRALKLIDVSNGQFIDDVNKLLEPVLCLARHPKQDLVVCGGGLGTPRIYRIADNQNRTAANNDTNLVRQFERQPGAVRAVAYSADGERIAVGGAGAEVRVYAVKDGARVAALGGHGGAVFALHFHPDGTRIATAGHDGLVRIFELPSGKLLRSFPPVPLGR